MIKSKYRCGRHGLYDPDFNREIEGHSCPRILCQDCELASYDDMESRPRNIKYFYEDDLKVVLTEAHLGSAVWRFSPPVIYPEWSFAEDLSPIVPEGAQASEEIMAKMEELLPEIEKLAQENGINIPDPRDLLILPGKGMMVDTES